MKYQCSACFGNVEMDGPYDGQVLECPHCRAAVTFQAINVMTPPPAQTVTIDEVIPASAAPVSDAIPIAEIAGPDQSPEDIAAALEELKGFCTAEETVVRVVVQSKLTSMTLKPDILAATTRRVIILERGLFSCQMWDAMWIDVADVKIEERLTGSVLRIALLNHSTKLVEHLPKAATREFYRYCQSREEQMRAARFAQQVHVKRAGASHVNVNIENQGVPPKL